MPSFKSLCPQEVRLFEPQFLALTTRHYKIQIWPGTTEKVGVGGEVMSSNQDSKNNVATLVRSKWVFRKVFAGFFTNTIKIQTELVYDKSMPASHRVVQDCNNGSNPWQGISLHNSPPSGSVLSSWKRFVFSHRKNFNPTSRFVVCSEHFTDDCFARSYHVEGSMKRRIQGAIPSVWKKNMKTIVSYSDRQMVSAFNKNFCCIYTFFSLLRFNISLLH